MTDDPRAIIAEDEPLLGAGLRRAGRTVAESAHLCPRRRRHPDTARLEEHKPDILFLDIQMPGLTGLGWRSRVSDVAMSCS
jgi:two-component SAPR family response regulator